MPFDIYQNLIDDETDEPLEEVAEAYFEQLVDLFAASPEGQMLISNGSELSWIHPFLDYGLNYLGATPTSIMPDDLYELLFDIFPRKISAPAEEAPEIMGELRAFFQFLEREFKLPNARDCERMLDEKATRKLTKEMANPANFGMAKSFVMQGQARGFDISSEERLNEWMNIYNVEAALGRGADLPLPLADLIPSMPGLGSDNHKIKPKSNSAQKKAKRKMAKESRRKNRK